jgi:hypothetical protein
MPKETTLPLAQDLQPTNSHIPFCAEHPCASTVMDFYTSLTPHPSRISSVFPVSSTHASTVLQPRRYSAIPFCSNCNSLHTNSDPFVDSTINDRTEHVQPTRPVAGQPIRLSVDADFLSTLLSRVAVYLSANTGSRKVSPYNFKKHFRKHSDDQSAWNRRGERGFEIFKSVPPIYSIGTGKGGIALGPQDMPRFYGQSGML